MAGSATKHTPQRHLMASAMQVHALGSGEPICPSSRFATRAASSA
jgi:hypothetical protein